MAEWEVEVWEPAPGRWRWSLFRKGILVKSGMKACQSERKAIEEARAAKTRELTPESRRRIALDDDE